MFSAVQAETLCSKNLEKKNCPGHLVKMARKTLFKTVAKGWKD